MLINRNYGILSIHSVECFELNFNKIPKIKKKQKKKKIIELELQIIQIKFRFIIKNIKKNFTHFLIIKKKLIE